MSTNILTQETLRELLDYDPETGEFTWKTRRLSLFARESRGKAWNSRYAGTVAGSPHSEGYIIIIIKRKHHRAHRLAWLYAYGEWPDGEVDHKNNCRTDNRLSNLRIVTSSMNKQNQRRSWGVSKLFGVSWNKRLQKWHAKIQLHYKQHHLGYFDTEKEARDAYLEAKRRMHPGFLEDAA